VLPTPGKTFRPDHIKISLPFFSVRASHWEMVGGAEYINGKLKFSAENNTFSAKKTIAQKIRPLFDNSTKICPRLSLPYTIVVGPFCAFSRNFGPLATLRELAENLKNGNNSWPP
jgi:hypothetical protein